jgi:hypothetical protein
MIFHPVKATQLTQLLGREKKSFSPVRELHRGKMQNFAALL